MTESTEAPSTGVNLDAIIADLEATDDRLPEEAIKAARLHKEAMIPRLIARIEDATSAARGGREVKGHGAFLSLFLLGEFRAGQALPAILKAVSLPGERPFDLFGDAITESLSAILAALIGQTHLDPLMALIDNKAVNEYVRRAAASALVTMVAAGMRPREEIVELLRKRLRRAIDEQDTDLIYGLVFNLDDLYPEEAYPEIREAYGKHLVDEGMIDLSNVDHTLKGGRDRCLKKLTAEPALIEDTIEELRHWAAFSPDAEYDDEEEVHEIPLPPYPSQLPAAPSLKPIRHSEAHVGRNDPCPCGSGKKFKRCCGRPL
jgi:Protein of unknown function (DUF1186)/SEC-C motif